MKNQWVYYIPLAGYILYFMEYYHFPYKYSNRRKEGNLFIIKHFLFSIIIALMYIILIK